MEHHHVTRNRTSAIIRALQSDAIGTLEPKCSRIKFVGSAGFRFHSRLDIYYYIPNGGFRNPEPGTQRHCSRRGPPQHFVTFLYIVTFALSAAAAGGATITIPVRINCPPPPLRHPTALKESGRDPSAAPAEIRAEGLLYRILCIADSSVFQHGGLVGKRERSLFPTSTLPW
jgi:hypothetical protein